MILRWKPGNELFGSWRGYSVTAEFGPALVVTAFPRESCFSNFTIWFVSLLLALHGTLWTRSIPRQVELCELGWILGQTLLQRLPPVCLFLSKAFCLFVFSCQLIWLSIVVWACCKAEGAEFQSWWEEAQKGTDILSKGVYVTAEMSSSHLGTFFLISS